MATGLGPLLYTLRDLSALRYSWLQTKYGALECN